MNCTLCGNSSVSAFKVNDYNILKCTSCNHYFTQLKISTEEVKNIYSDNYFFGGGDGYPDYTLEKDMLIRKGEYYSKKIEKFIKSGKVLDIGCASGFIIKGFENKGWKATGIEPNASMSEYGRDLLGLDIRQGTIEEVKLTEKYDLILMIQVIAHLFDLNASMKNVYKHLKPGGYLLIETWNRSSLTAALFGKLWHEYSPPGTLNFFDKRNLLIFLKKYNFQHIKTGRPEKKLMSNHAKSLIKHKLKSNKFMKYFSGAVNIVPDNILLPYPAEDLFWSLYQKVK